MKAKLLLLFLNESFRAIAVSFLTVFSGVFIYKTILEKNNDSKIALVAVALYFLGLYFFKFLSHLAAEELSLKRGLKICLWLGQAFLAACLAMLFLSPGQPLFLALASIFFGLSSGFYWTGYHGLLAKTGKEAHFGEQIGMAGAMRNILLLLVPIMAGLLISLFGYPGLFLGGFLFILFSSGAAVSLENPKTHIDTSLPEILGLFETQTRAFWAHFGHSFAGTIYGTIFPLYVFFSLGALEERPIFGKELGLGGFFSLSLALTAIINFLVGKWIDKKGFGRPLALGSVVSFLVWLGRGLFRNAGALLSLDIVDRLTSSMIGIPIDVLTYEKAIEDKATGRAVLFREVALGLGAILACVVILGITLGGLPIEYSFFIAAIFSLFSIFLIEKR